jgi:hypothetical protein
MGILGNFRDAVNLVNRTSRELNVRYDGEDITLKPGENPGFPIVAVPYAKRQNPLMGSKHPLNPQKFIALVGIKAFEGEKQKDDITPISDETLALADAKLEVVDRSGEFWGEVMGKRVLLRKKPFDAFEAQVSMGEIGDSGFTGNQRD